MLSTKAGYLTVYLNDLELVGSRSIFLCHVSLSCREVGVTRTNFLPRSSVLTRYYF